MRVYFSWPADDIPASYQEDLPVGLITVLDQRDLLVPSIPGDTDRHVPAAKAWAAWQAVLDWRRAELAQRILEHVDLVQLVGSLNPDASGYGQPHAYDEPFRELIREAQALLEKESEY